MIASPSSIKESAVLFEKMFKTSFTPQNAVYYYFIFLTNMSKVTDCPCDKWNKLVRKNSTGHKVFIVIIAKKNAQESFRVFIDFMSHDFCHTNSEF